MNEQKQKGELVFTPEFLAACRSVLGDDKPATVLGALNASDPRITEVLALAHRDPKRWFVSALDEHGIPRVYARGDTQREALKKAQLAATEYRASKQKFRQVAGRTDWTFHPYPPEDWRSLSHS